MVPAFVLGAPLILAVQAKSADGKLAGRVWRVCRAWSSVAPGDLLAS